MLSSADLFFHPLLPLKKSLEVTLVLASARGNVLSPTSPVALPCCHCTFLTGVFIWSRCMLTCHELGQWNCKVKNTQSQSTSCLVSCQGKAITSATKSKCGPKNVYSGQTCLRAVFCQSRSEPDNKSTCHKTTLSHLISGDKKSYDSSRWMRWT